MIYPQLFAYSVKLNREVCGKQRQFSLTQPRSNRGVMWVKSVNKKEANKMLN